MSQAELIISFELGLIYGIVAIGVYLTFRVIDFQDLTCDGSFVLGAVVSAVIVKAGYNPFLALLAALLAGGITGFTTGILNVALKINELLAGILVAFMLYSINLKIMGGIPNIALITESTIFTFYDQHKILVIIAGLILGLCSYLLLTDFGLALRSLGQNKRVALNYGVNIKRLTIIGLVISNALIGLAGALFSQQQGFADVSQGVGTVIVALAAVIIGEKVLPSRSPWITIFACIVGSIIYRIIVAAALRVDWLGLETQDLNLITGLLVILIMIMPKTERLRCLS